MIFRASVRNILDITTRTNTDTLVKNEMLIMIFYGVLCSYRRAGQQNYLDISNLSSSKFIIRNIFSSSPKSTSPMKIKQRCKINIMTTVHFTKLSYSKTVLSVQKQATCNGTDDVDKPLMVT
jgi:hypothetical protein